MSYMLAMETNKNSDMDNKTKILQYGNTKIILEMPNPNPQTDKNIIDNINSIMSNELLLQFFK